MARRCATAAICKLQVARTKPGESVPVKVLRDGSTKTLDGHHEGTARHARSSPRQTPRTGGNGTLERRGSGRTGCQRPAPVEHAGEHQGRGGDGRWNEDSAAAEAGLRAGRRDPGDQPQAGAKCRGRGQAHGGPKDKTTLLRVWSKGGKPLRGCGRKQGRLIFAELPGDTRRALLRPWVGNRAGGPAAFVTNSAARRS